jgi:hypothetical protein
MYLNLTENSWNLTNILEKRQKRKKIDDTFASKKIGKNLSRHLQQSSYIRGTVRYLSCAQVCITSSFLYKMQGLHLRANGRNVRPRISCVRPNFWLQTYTDVRFIWNTPTFHMVDVLWCLQPGKMTWSDMTQQGVLWKYVYSREVYSLIICHSQLISGQASLIWKCVYNCR